MVVGTVVAVMEVVCCDMFVELNHCNRMAIAYLRFRMVATYNNLDKKSRNFRYTS